MHNSPANSSMDLSCCCTWLCSFLCRSSFCYILAIDNFEVICPFWYTKLKCSSSKQLLSSVNFSHLCRIGLHIKLHESQPIQSLTKTLWAAMHNISHNYCIHHMHSDCSLHHYTVHASRVPHSCINIEVLLLTRRSGAAKTLNSKCAECIPQCTYIGIHKIQGSHTIHERSDCLVRTLQMQTVIMSSTLE